MRCPACDHDNFPGEDLCAACGLDLAGLDVAAWSVDPEDPLLKLPVGSLQLKEPLVLDARSTVAQALAVMKEHHEGCVFVVGAGGELEGLFTERDATTRVALPGRDPEATPLAAVLTRDPRVLRPEDPLAWALNRMGAEGYRHLPVLDGRRLMGYVSARTVLKSLLES